MRGIFRTIHGSHLYNLQTPESDEDYKSVHLAFIHNLVTQNFLPQIKNSKDDVSYELSEFCRLLKQSDPIVLEMLFSQKGISHNIFQPFIDNRHKFLSKKAFYKFVGAAESQIKKGTAVNKMINRKEVIRKTPLDFCWVVLDGERDTLFPNTSKQGDILLTQFLELHHIEQRNCILNKLSHGKEVYLLYVVNYLTRGICDEKSNELRMESSPADATPFATICYNEDGYRNHCTEHRQWTEWMEKRNEERVKLHAATGQHIDTKNMMHGLRFLDNLEQILTKGTFELECSPERRDFLLKVKRAEIEPELVRQMIVDKIEDLKILKENSSLREEVDMDYIDELYRTARLEQIRNEK